MYENKSTEHERDRQGRVNLPKIQKRPKGGLTRFMSVALTTMALGLALTGLLLHASMQSNAKNLAKIEELQRGAVTRTAQPASDQAPAEPCPKPEQPTEQPPAQPEQQNALPPAQEITE